ncbi:MAG: cadmium-translocating P-type ATPase [Clostridia bacterium]|nr:cadmium-translocating P-type ATPase [Clostridia bacterium]
MSSSNSAAPVQVPKAHHSNQHIFQMTGLGCATCAAKIEAEISQLEGVQSARLDFVSQRLIIEALDSKAMLQITQKAGEIAARIEPGAAVVIGENTGSAPVEVKNAPARTLRLVLFGIGFALLLLAQFAPLPTALSLMMFIASYLLIGAEVVLAAVRNIARGQLFDENFLMSLATVGAFAIGDYPEAVSVMLFYQIGEFFQDLAVNRSRRSIAALMDIRPEFANRVTDDGIETVPPEHVSIDDIILVKPGERVPLDGSVLEGISSLDTSALTGESLPRDVEPGSTVYSGAINISGVLRIQVSKPYGESTVARILELVQNASSRKAPTEQFITKFARYYTPAVVFAAAALAFLPPLLIPGAVFSDWLHRALIFLVVSCPCALVVSIPLTFFGGIGSASHQGILVKGSNYLEALNAIDTVVFDKTGTLTRGIFSVTEVSAAGDLTDARLLQLAAQIEQFSNHPIAVSICKAYGQKLNSGSVTDYQEASGQGLSATIDGQSVLAGNSRYLGSQGIEHEQVVTAGTVVYLAVAGQYAGHLVISDQLKADSLSAIQRLRGLGIRSIALLTGDTKSTGQAIGSQLGLDTVLSELLPHQKVAAFESLADARTTKGKIVFVGDGINDAPVLARSDVGIAMGGIGSDAAIEAADIVLMTDEPSKLATAIEIARKTRTIVWQNIVFALGVKAIILLLGALGMASMWAAVFGDVGVALIAVLNAMRILRKRN